MQFSNLPFNKPPWQIFDRSSSNGSLNTLPMSSSAPTRNEESVSVSPTHSLLERSSAAFPEATRVRRPRLVPRQAGVTKQRTAVESDTPISSSCSESCSVKQMEGSTSATDTSTNASGDVTMNNDPTHYFSPLLVHEEDDLLLDDYNDGVQSNLLDPITLQYWRDNPHMQSFDLLGVIEDNYNLESTENMPSTCFILPTTPITNDSLLQWKTNMNMLLTTPRDTADHYRLQAARLWDEYYNTATPFSDLLSPTHISSSRITSGAPSTVLSKHMPSTILEKLEDKSPLLKNFVLMEQHREMRKFLEQHHELLRKFVCRGEELSQQKREYDTGDKTVETVDMDESNNSNNSTEEIWKSNGLAADESKNNLSINDKLEQLESSVQESRRNADPFIFLQKCDALVPKIFFEPDFSLSDPVTYDSILSLLQNNTDYDSSASATDDGDIEGKPIVIDNPLFDQTTSSFHQYWDSVDAALREQVVCKSDDFFLENATFRELEILVAHANVDVTSLREEIEHIKFDDYDDIPKMAHQRMCLQRLHAVIDAVSHLVDLKQSIEQKMRSKDYQEAYRLISQTIDDIDKQQFCQIERHLYNIVDFIVIFEIREKLLEYKTFVVEKVKSLLVEAFISWNFTCYEDVDQTTRSAIRDLVGFAASIQQLSVVNQRYTCRLSEMVYVTVKATVTECIIDASMKPNRPDTYFATAPEKRVGRKYQHNAFPQDFKQDKSNISSCASPGLVGMTGDEFCKCLVMIFEQLTALLRSSSSVLDFFDKEGIALNDYNNASSVGGGISNKSIGNLATANLNYQVPKTTALYAASELSQSLISDLFQARKEALPFITFEEIKNLWKICSDFASDIEDFFVGATSSASVLRSNLLAQAKSFVDQQQIRFMTDLAACLENEKWSPCAISAERQFAIAKLCGEDAINGESVNKADAIEARMHKIKECDEADIRGTKYKIVGSCMVLIDMIISELEQLSFLDCLSLMIAKKITELLRLFNTRAKQMVLGARALRSGAQLQSINTKHLALVVQCIDFITAAMVFVQSELVRNFPISRDSQTEETIAFVKQEFETIKEEYDAHREMIFEKFVTVIKAVVQHSLAPQIARIDFDNRAMQFSSEIGSEKSGAAVEICSFLEGILTNATMMHQVLSSMLPEMQLQEIFLRIFTYIDQYVPVLFVKAAQATASKMNATTPISKANPGFSFPKKRGGMRRMIEEIIWTTAKLNQLSGVKPYTFTMASILGRKMGAVRKVSSNDPGTDDSVRR